ncbi:MAG: hypothetical protein KDC49_22400 [Saprospiraceae bacterium]|nr:hypothetical protein [Saprospiraceae bacterium]
MDKLQILLDINSRVLSHNFDNPDVYALFGYVTYIIKFSEELMFDFDKAALNGLWEYNHNYQKELEFAVEENKSNYAALHLLKSAAFDFDVFIKKEIKEAEKFK